MEGGTGQWNFQFQMGPNPIGHGQFDLEFEVRLNPTGPVPFDVGFQMRPHPMRPVSVTTSPVGNFTSLDQATGRIYQLAKDWQGCQFLIAKCAEGRVQDVEKIFVEVIDHIVELMTHPVGNRLVQMLLQVCTNDQKSRILDEITKTPGELVRVSVNQIGNQVVQKIIETLVTPEQFSLFLSSLKPGIVDLMKDATGNHVAIYCLRHLSPEHKEYLFGDAVSNEDNLKAMLAKVEDGCNVLQACLHHLEGELRRRVVLGITSDAPNLSQQRYGNYLVQEVLGLSLPWATASLLDRLEGSYGYLSMQKYGSLVVGHCLANVEEASRHRIVQELISNNHFDQILLDPYGNYVIQSAVRLSTGDARAALVEAIFPHVPTLRTSPRRRQILTYIGI